jgi:hypothetical protein
MIRAIQTTLMTRRRGNSTPLGRPAAHGDGRSSLLALLSAPRPHPKTLMRHENLCFSLLFSTFLYLSRFITPFPCSRVFRYILLRSIAGLHDRSRDSAPARSHCLSMLINILSMFSAEPYQPTRSIFKHVGTPTCSERHFCPRVAEMLRPPGQDEGAFRRRRNLWPTERRRRPIQSVELGAYWLIDVLSLSLPAFSVMLGRRK